MGLFENIVDELDNNGFKVTIEWMKTKYDEMNKMLFGGALGNCNFNIHVKGKGARSHNYGLFYFGRSVKVDPYKGRRMYVYDRYADKVYLNSENFAIEGQPTISINGNVMHTEKSALSVLVHEMCHYYTYRNGWAPKQGHGPEFHAIAFEVNRKAKGMIFPVETHVNLEQYNELEWSDEIKAQKQKRANSKVARRKVILVYHNNGEIRLINTASQALIDEIVGIESKRNNCIKVVMSVDTDLKEQLNTLGYRSDSSTYRYWSVQNKQRVLDVINQYTWTTLYSSEQGNEEPVEDPNLIKNFSFKLTNGKTFNATNVTIEQLKDMLHKEFPNWSDQAIDNIIQRQAATVVREDIEAKVKNFVNERLNNFKQILSETHMHSLFHFMCLDSLRRAFETKKLELNDWESSYNYKNYPYFLSTTRNRNSVTGFPWMVNNEGGTRHFNSDGAVMVRLELDGEALRQYGKVHPFDWVHHESLDDYSPLYFFGNGKEETLGNLGSDDDEDIEILYRQPYSQAEERLSSEHAEIPFNKRIVKRIDIYIDTYKVNKNDWNYVGELKKKYPGFVHTYTNSIRGKFEHQLEESKKKKVYNDKGEEVPETCTCGGKIGLYIKGEPVYLCSKCKKYYGTMP